MNWAGRDEFLRCSAGTCPEPRRRGLASWCCRPAVGTAALRRAAKDVDESEDKHGGRMGRHGGASPGRKQGQEDCFFSSVGLSSADFSGPCMPSLKWRIPSPSPFAISGIRRPPKKTSTMARINRSSVGPSLPIGVPPVSDSRLLADRRQQNKQTPIPQRRRFPPPARITG